MKHSEVIHFMFYAASSTYIYIYICTESFKYLVTRYTLITWYSVRDLAEPCGSLYCLTSWLAELNPYIWKTSCLGKVRCNTFVLSPLRFPNWYFFLEVILSIYFPFSIVSQDLKYRIIDLISLTILGKEFRSKCLPNTALLSIDKCICFLRAAIAQTVQRLAIG